MFNLLEEETQAKSEILYAGDRIIVPSKRNQVYVKGEVVQPGLYPYLANYTAKDYAGSTGILDTVKDFKDIYVIHSETGKIENGGDVVVQNGDIVVVPQRRREIFKDYMFNLTPIISIGLSAYALIRTSR